MNWIKQVFAAIGRAIAVSARGIWSLPVWLFGLVKGAALRLVQHVRTMWAMDEDFWRLRRMTIDVGHCVLYTFVT